MANTAQAKKRARQNDKARAHNASLRSMVRTYIKNVVKAIQSGNLDSAKAAYAAAVPVIDRIADKGIIHKNNAARRKGRLMKKLTSFENGTSAAAAKPAKKTSR